MHQLIDDINSLLGKTPKSQAALVEKVGLLISEVRKAPAHQDNLWLWKKLASEVDPRFLSPYICEDGTTLTAISHVHGRNAMTEIFGPCGTGWGYEIAEPCKLGSVTATKVTMWYKPHCYAPEAAPEVKAYIEEYGSAVTPGKEAFKTMVSSALNRCFMALGHAAALYAGIDLTPPKREAPHVDALADNPDAPAVQSESSDSGVISSAEHPIDSITLPAFDAPLSDQASQVLDNLETVVTAAIQDEKRHILHEFIDAFGLMDVKVEYCAFLSPDSPNLDDTFKHSAQTQTFFKKVIAQDFGNLPEDCTISGFFSTEDEELGVRLEQTLGFQSKNGVFRAVISEAQAATFLSDIGQGDVAGDCHERQNP